MSMNTTNSQEQEFLTIRDLWDIFLDNIWLFVVSVAVCVSIAIAYIIVTPPTYERSTSVLIKDEEKGNSISSSSMQGFEDLGLFNSNVNVNNEVEVIQTIPNIEEVVRRLGLQYNYSFHHKGLRWIDLYGRNPFVLNVDSTLTADISFLIEFQNATDYVIEDLEINENEFDDDIRGKINTPIETAFGSFKISSTPLFSDSSAVNTTFRVSRIAINQAAKNYKENIVANLNAKENTIIDISFTDVNPMRAEHFLNTLVSVYNEKWILDKNEITINTSHFIDDRINVIQSELGTVDDNISDYKSKALMPDYVAVTGISLEESKTIRASILDLNNQLSMAQYVQTYLKSINNGEQLLPANTGIDNTAIEGLISEYNELMLQKNVLLSNSSAKNPIVAEMIVNLTAMRGVINTSINDYINTLSIQIKSAEQEDRKNKAYLASNPKQAKELLGVERQQKIKENLYLFLLEKREENELSQTFSAYNTKILAPADGDKDPVAPRTMIVLLFGLVIGGVIPVAYLFIKASFDTKVKSKDDLTGSTIPFLGSIPLVKDINKKRLSFGSKKKEEKEGDFVVISDSRNGIDEMFRVVRTNLDFMIANTSSGCKTTMMTSFNPKSGKSFFSFNIALSMSMKNNKVLAIDGDFRRGTLSKVVKSPRKGLVDYLNGSISNINDVIVKGSFDTSISVLPMGTMPPNPTELLLTGKFEVLMEQLKKEYDYIFFDCPPIEIVPDATIIEKYCDSTIFVVRAGLMDKRLLPDLETLYASKKLKNMSLVLNGVDYTKNSRYGYGKYGYGKYGYGKYGYGSYGNTNSSENAGGEASNYQVVKIENLKDKRKD